MKTMYKITCTNCDLEEKADKFRRADIIRDRHESEVINWDSNEDVCGPCSIDKIK